MPELTLTTTGVDRTCSNCHFWSEMNNDGSTIAREETPTQIDGLQMFGRCAPASTIETNYQLFMGWPASAIQNVGDGDGMLITARNYGCNMHEPTKGGSLAEDS